MSASGAANAHAGAPMYPGPGAQAGPTPPRLGYDADRVPGYDPYRAGQGYNPQIGFRVSTYATQGMPAYELARGQIYNPQSQIPPSNNMPYPNAAPAPRIGGSGSGNPVRK